MYANEFIITKFAVRRDDGVSVPKRRPSRDKEHSPHCKGNCNRQNALDDSARTGMGKEQGSVHQGT